MHGPCTVPEADSSKTKQNVTSARVVPYTPGMRVAGSALAVAAAALVLVACGSGSKPAAGPPATIAGVGVTTKGPAPKPSTPAACARRWNGSANASGRAAAERRLPAADRAVVRSAASTGSFADVSGRCLVYLVARRRAAIFVETSRGKFGFTADASGHFSTNARLRGGARLRLG